MCFKWFATEDLLLDHGLHALPKLLPQLRVVLRPLGSTERLQILVRELESESATLLVRGEVHWDLGVAFCKVADGRASEEGTKDGREEGDREGEALVRGGGSVDESREDVVRG